MYDVDKKRRDFPMLSEDMSGKRFVYFDSAATAQKPKSVIEAISHFYTYEYATVHRAVYEHAINATEKYSETRRLVQAFMNAALEEEIIFTRGATEAINLVAMSYGKCFLKEGDEILISEMEHHSNIVPWQLLAEEVSAKLVVAPINDKGEIILEEFEKRLNSRTKIVSIAHVSNALGTINPIQTLAKLAKNVGAIVLVDGCQAAPHLPINVKDLDVDFYTFSGHKCYGPTGIGILYGKKELLEQMRPYHGGGDMIRDVTFAKTTYQAPPLKFEAGTPLIAEVIGLGAAIKYLNALDRLAVLEHETKLQHAATQELQAIPGLRIYGPLEEKAALVSFSIEGIHPLDLGTLIALKGVALRTGTLCAQPALARFDQTSLARISFGLYNTLDEVHYFLAALKETISLLR